MNRLDFMKLYTVKQAIWKVPKLVKIFSPELFSVQLSKPVKRFETTF